MSNENENKLQGYKILNKRNETHGPIEFEILTIKCDGCGNCFEVWKNLDDNPLNENRIVKKIGGM